jgi:hypothetical protein
MNAPLPALALAALIAAGLSACSNSTPQAAPSTPNSAPGATIAPAGSSPVSTPAGQTPTRGASTAGVAPTPAQLRTIVLRASDLPAGWSSAPYRIDPKAATLDAAQAACIGVRNVDPDRVGDIHSSTFSHGGDSVDSEAASYRSAADLAVDRATMHSPKLAPCEQSLLKANLPGALPAGTTLVSVKVTVTPSSATNGIIGTSDTSVVLSRGGSQFAIDQRLVDIQAGLVTVTLDFSSSAQGFPGPLKESLATVVLNRVLAG